MEATGLIVTILSFVGLLFWLAMVLWNNLIPEIFGLSKISYWQAAGLMILAQILFGNYNSSRRE